MFTREELAAIGCDTWLYRLLCSAPATWLARLLALPYRAQRQLHVRYVDWIFSRPHDAAATSPPD